MVFKSKANYYYNAYHGCSNEEIEKSLCFNLEIYRKNIMF